MIPQNLEIEWDKGKSKRIKRERGKSFEELVEYIRAGKVLAYMEHRNKARYPNQKLIVLDVDGYPWVLPCEIRGNKLRLITAFPSRRYKDLIKGEKNG